MNYTTLKKADTKNRITEKEIELLKDLYYLRYISKEQIWRYYFSNTRTSDENTRRHSRRRISILIKNELLTEKVLLNGSKAYKLSNFGYQIATDKIAKEFKNDLEAIQFYAKKNAYSDLGMRSLFIPHLLETNEIYLQLKYKYDSGNWIWINSLNIKRLEVDSENLIVPDAQIKFSKDGTERIIHIETDMNTENLSKLKSKVSRYDKYSFIRKKSLEIKRKSSTNNNYVMFAFKNDPENQRFVHRSTALLEYTLKKVNSNSDANYSYSFGDTSYITAQIYNLIEVTKSSAFNAFTAQCKKSKYEYTEGEVFIDEDENKQTNPDLSFSKENSKSIVYDLSIDNTKKIEQILNAIDISTRKTLYNDIYILCNSYSQFSQMLAITDFNCKPYYLLKEGIEKGIAFKIDQKNNEVKELSIF